MVRACRCCDRYYYESIVGYCQIYAKIKRSSYFNVYPVSIEFVDPFPVVTSNCNQQHSILKMELKNLLNNVNEESDKTALNYIEKIYEELNKYPLSLMDKMLDT